MPDPPIDQSQAVPATGPIGITPPVFGTPRRWGVFLTGVAFLMVGIALSVTADLGVGSWQVLETGVMETTGLSFAVVVLIESVVALTLAWVWLGQRPWIATVLMAFAGVGIGAMLAVLETPEAVIGQVVMLAVGVTLIGVGVAFYLASDLGASAQDAMFVGFYRTYSVRPGLVRLGLDATLVVSGALLGGQIGAGTVLVTVGVPVVIEPALRAGHRLAGTPLPAALAR